MLKHSNRQCVTKVNFPHSTRSQYQGYVSQITRRKRKTPCHPTIPSNNLSNNNLNIHLHPHRHHHRNNNNSINAAGTGNLVQVAAAPRTPPVSEKPNATHGAVIPVTIAENQIISQMYAGRSCKKVLALSKLLT